MSHPTTAAAPASVRAVAQPIQTQLIDWPDPETCRVISVLAYTGMRFGELSAMHVGQIDVMRTRADCRVRD